MKIRKGSREGGKNKVMEAKHKKAKREGVKAAIYINLMESMGDYQNGRLKVDRDSCGVYSAHAKYMAERKGSAVREMKVGDLKIVPMFDGYYKIMRKGKRVGEICKGYEEAYAECVKLNG